MTYSNTQCLGISLHQSTCMAECYGHFKSPHYHMRQILLLLLLLLFIINTKRLMSAYLGYNNNCFVMSILQVHCES